MKLSRFVVLMCLMVMGLSSTAQRLVLPGDYPDPSVVKIGDTYWASATTSNWMPAYPLLKSKDLIKWEVSGHVFNQKPDWVDYYFWAPEITYENGKVYIYYSAHKKGGNLCVGIASADKPEGPYKDHGPIICQEVGSIDGFPMRDEAGKLYMIWKEDANSVGKPTPIWAQELNEERTALVGEKKELFRNDAPWEGNLVEGVSMVKKGGYYYAIYAAAGCCGTGCTYNTGIARAKDLLGPWEKYSKNPVLVNSEEWKCPGHGTPVEKDGKNYFLYHAYNKESSVYTGRQGLLIEFKFTPGGWIEFVTDDAPDINTPKLMADDFNGRSLNNQWQWSVFEEPVKLVRKKALELNAQPSSTGAFLGQKVVSENYTVTSLVKTRKSNAKSGLALIGDEKNAVSVLVSEDSVKVIQVKDNKENILSSLPLPKNKKLYLQMRVKNGKDITFLYGKDREHLTTLNDQPIDGSYLPPWDRAPRIGIIAKGNINEKAIFDFFEVRNE